MGKIAFDVDRVGSLRGGQGMGAKALAADGFRHQAGYFVQAGIDPGVFIGVGLIGALLDAGHNVRIHRQRPTNRIGQPPPAGYRRGGKIGQVCRSPELNSMG